MDDSHINNTENFITVSPKDFKALKKSGYEKKRHLYNKVFVLKHKRTKRIVELRAVSSFQACKFIGWKFNQVTLLEERYLSDNEQTKEPSHNPCVLAELLGKKRCTSAVLHALALFRPCVFTIHRLALGSHFL